MGETLGHPAAGSLDLQATSSNDSAARALSDEVGTGSSQESAAKQEARGVTRPNGVGHGSGLPTEILERVLGSFSGVPPRIARSVGPLTVFNEKGHRPPIFWCFNHYAEPVLLAARLGADQPLYAMHSFQGILDDWREKQRYGPHLAQVYAEAILSAAGAARILIGGNCQSADIIEIAARTIAKRRGTTPLLMMLESEPALPYGGPLLMMFGDRSGYNNPFLKEADPVGRWWSRHANFAWGIVRGIHGSYFREPGIFDLTGFLRQAVDAIEQTGRLAPGEMRRSEGLHPA